MKHRYIVINWLEPTGFNPDEHDPLEDIEETEESFDTLSEAQFHASNVVFLSHWGITRIHRETLLKCKYSKIRYWEKDDSFPVVECDYRDPHSFYEI